MLFEAFDIARGLEHPFEHIQQRGRVRSLPGPGIQNRPCHSEWSEAGARASDLLLCDYKSIVPYECKYMMLLG